MRPPMNQRVNISQVLMNQGQPIYDDYGIPKTGTVASDARVRRKTNLIRTANGTEHNATLEIDVPANVQVESGSTINFIDMDGNEGSGVVVSYEDATNITGSRVLFRTVYVDG
ncbi:hypothetical protein [Macrococcus brunensis]|uniref:hypothetical protein n=1 Tax=Macrococcus brunensis TaxID=198483 RepID=UPI001EF10969|nr:hypothetical protein [Macrococcus brunensis]ULG70876.1 hypothetical protein MGG12_05795 [Macrococcus brunensis]